jgi:uncharacterized protein (TIGR02687 family)
MVQTNIKNRLLERFAAPLQEFYNRRIIFWHDEDQEFENIIDELALDNVIIKKLYETNNFAIKKLLTHDDLTNNYLIYNPISYKNIQDNWLLDVELYSEKFRADFISMQMEELNIEPTSAMIKTVKLYKKFLENKERKEKLRKIGRNYNIPIEFHTDVMAVLCALNGGSAQDIIRAVLSADLDKENNTALINIEKFGNIDVFWKLIEKQTGYIYNEEKTLENFAAWILLTALSFTIDEGAIKGLERFVSNSYKRNCYSFIKDWYASENRNDLQKICRCVEENLHLAERFDKIEVETLLTSDIFPCINECILKHFFCEIKERVVKTELIFKTYENRRTLAWYELTENYFECLYYIAMMEEFSRKQVEGFHIVEPTIIWKLYIDNYYLMDRYYRHFHHFYGKILSESNTLLEDGLKHDVDYVEGLYQNWFLKEITSSWINAIADDLKDVGHISEINKQKDFYKKYVIPISNKKNRAFIIISDAFRYEVAVELAENLNRTMKGNATVEAMQATFPSITKFGMASLLPNKKISVNDSMDVLVDGSATDTTVKREKILNDANENSIAIKYNDFLKMKKQERRDRTIGKEVIYIYHDEIDAMGEKPQTENKVFEACEIAIKELLNTVKIIIDELSGTNIFITSDHGFLYTYNPLEESQKVSKSIFNGADIEIGRRYALVKTETEADYLVPISMKSLDERDSIMGYAPQDITRIKISGGGENYVHGGISLQEIVVPVIVYKNIRATSKRLVESKNAEIILLGESRRISNLIFFLNFYQKSPIGDKVQPCTYSVYMIDDNNIPVSDKKIIIADRVEDNNSERVFQVKFNLKPTTFDKNKVYRLVITNDIDTPEEIKFCIDTVFVDDFGFDL